jgi:hypothetical protein
MVPLPNLRSKVVNALGILVAPWNSFLQQFVQAPPNALPVTLTGSPFEYQAAEPGLLTIVGGTVSIINYSRGSVTVNVTGSRFVPVCLNDIVEITYSVAPTVYFFPNYGNKPT